MSSNRKLAALLVVGTCVMGGISLDERRLVAAAEVTTMPLSPGGALEDCLFCDECFEPDMHDA